MDNNLQFVGTSLNIVGDTLGTKIMARNAYQGQPNVQTEW